MVPALLSQSLTASQASFFPLPPPCLWFLTLAQPRTLSLIHRAQVTFGSLSSFLQSKPEHQYHETTVDFSRCKCMLCMLCLKCFCGALCADAENDTEVSAISDNVEYRKGGSVLRMLWNYMTSDDYKSSKLPPDYQTAHSQDVRHTNPCMHIGQHVCHAHL